MEKEQEKQQKEKENKRKNGKTKDRKRKIRPCGSSVEWAVLRCSDLLTPFLFLRPPARTKSRNNNHVTEATLTLWVIGRVGSAEMFLDLVDLPPEQRQARTELALLLTPVTEEEEQKENGQGHRRKEGNKNDEEGNYILRRWRARRGKGCTGGGEEWKKRRQYVRVEVWKDHYGHGEHAHTVEAGWLAGEAASCSAAFVDLLPTPSSLPIRSASAASGLAGLLRHFDWLSRHISFHDEDHHARTVESCELVRRHHLIELLSALSKPNQ